MKKILLVSHCLLNTASKLKSYDLGDMEAEEALRRSLLAVIFILSAMILPTMVSLCETAVRAVPQAYREGSLALGATDMLAFWCGNVEEQIDRIFRESGLMREKWDRNTGDSTYGQITIRNAVSSNSTIYTPIRDAAASAEDEFKDLDDPEGSEEKSPFRPALSFVTVKLEDMKPHTNPRYQRDEIGIGNAFAD